LQNKSIKTEYYSPAEDTLFFANHIQNEKGKSALDIGTGSGYLANVLLTNFEVVIATDISFDAIKKAQFNPKLYLLQFCRSTCYEI
jgi:release factor glutamine methyltransferase